MSAPVASLADWSAEASLADYYSRIEPEERCTLRCLVEQFRKLPRNCLALEFGTNAHGFAQCVEELSTHVCVTERQATQGQHVKQAVLECTHGITLS